jgi:hypothetical protein
VPLEAWTAATITAVRHEDAEDMPDDAALAWRFTRATLDHEPIADEYRQEITRRWGPRAVISLAFAMVAPAQHA